MITPPCASPAPRGGGGALRCHCITCTGNFSKDCVQVIRHAIVSGGCPSSGGGVPESVMINIKYFLQSVELQSRSKTVPEKSVIDYHCAIGSRFWNCNRDHDCDQKPIRKNRYDFHCGIGSRFSCENRSAILISKSICDWKPVPGLQVQMERTIGSLFFR